jgi:Carboxypeptidase regulatory-like domain
MNRSRIVSVVLVTLAACSVSLAQFSSSVQGTVRDSSGAAVAEANVRLRDQGTDVTNRSTTNAEGFYRFNSLPIGRYSVTVERQGFQSQIVEVDVTAGQSRDVDVTLPVAAANQSVNVTGEAALVDTTETRIHLSIDAEKLQNLPVLSNNLIGLMSMAPGIVGNNGDQGDNFTNEYFPDMSGNGRSWAGNQFNMDGITVTSNVTTGTLNWAPNPDAIEELTVETNTFKVDQGIGSSVVVNMITKSGGNQFHGSGKYLFNNQDMWAKTHFTDPSGYTPFKKHDISGTFGGPIIKDKTFFFASVEALRSEVSSGKQGTTFEAPEFVTWAQQNFPNTIGTGILTHYPVIGLNNISLNSTAADVFGADCGTPTTYNLPCNLPMIDNGTYDVSPYRNGLQYSFRGDQYLNGGKDRIFGSYMNMDEGDQNPANRQSFSSLNSTTSWATEASWTHTFSSALLNEATFNGDRVFGWSTKSAPFSVPTIAVQGVGLNVDPGWSGLYAQHNYNWRDVVSWVKGNHSLRIGAGFFRDDDTADFRNAQGRPNFGFNSLLDLVTDNPYSEGGVAYDPLTGTAKPFVFGAKGNGESLFFQDEWRVRPNLTLTMGVRWDDFGNPVGVDGYQYSNMFLGSGSLDQRFEDATVKAVNSPFSHRLNRNFAPRFGYAWSPGFSGKTSIRGGIGVYHNWVDLGETVDLLRINPPGFIFPEFNQTTTIKPLFSLGTQNTTWPFGYTLPTIPAGQLNAAGGLDGVQSSVAGINPNLSTPLTLNWVAGVEQELPWHLVGSANYSGSRTWGALSGTDFNRVNGDLLDGNLDRLTSNFGSMTYINNVNEMWYKALLLTVRRSFGSLFSFQASYNLSSAQDLGQGGDRTLGTLYDDFDDPSNLHRKGPSSWDVRNRVSASGLINFPTPFAHSGITKAVLGGWEMGFTLSAQSGSPYSVVNTNDFADGGDYNADGYNYDYPNMPSQNFGGSHTRQQYLNGIFTAADFPAPTLGTDGNFKRNSYRNPGYFGVNSSLIKESKLPFIGERGSLQLRFDFFNLFNRTNLGTVDRFMGDSTFGTVQSQLDPRVLQVGAKLIF